MRISDWSSDVCSSDLLDGGYLHGDCITVTGKTIEQQLEGVTLPSDQDVVRPCSSSLTPTGGVVGLRGNLAPEGARWEEHTAELQSIMRSSYAVLCWKNMTIWPTPQASTQRT